jgi:predicted aconitase
MQLTKEQQEMLSGKHGPGRHRSMELLVAVGEVFDAPCMIPVGSSHLVIPEIQLFHKGEKARWGQELTRTMLEGVDRFAVPTTTNATILDLDRGTRLRMPEPFLEEMRPVFGDTKQLYESRGAIPTYSCAPYFDFFYRFGEHLGGAESIQVLFNNSVNGSRVNRETGPTALAVAITGVTPCYGMHLPENRAGQILFELASDIDPSSLSDADLNAIGYYAGRIAEERIPVFSGFSTGMTATELKYLCVPLAVSAGIAMMHVVGVTPEASTLDQAFQGRKPEKTIAIGRGEIQSSYERLNTAHTEDLEYVSLGCPHCSLQELEGIAKILDGRRVSANVVLFIAVSTIKYDLAKRMGIVAQIEQSGAVVVSGMCPGASIFGRYGRELAVRTVATNSAKNAHYMGAHSGGWVKTHFGSTRKCVDSAVAGKWAL